MRAVIPQSPSNIQHEERPAKRQPDHMTLDKITMPNRRCDRSSNKIIHLHLDRA